MSTMATELPSVSIEAAMQQTPPKLEPKLVIFAWSGELDKIWPTLILATTSAAMGQETTVFPSNHGGFLGGEFGQRGDPEAFAAKLREVLDDPA